MQLMMILGVIEAATKLVGSLAGVVNDAKGVLSSADQEAVAKAMADMRTENDALYDAVQAKLKAAAQQ